jgi:hypothetical protein
MTKPDDKKIEPMDDSIKEAREGTPFANAPRQCWAMKTLISEVHSLFPETPYEVSNIDGRNTALDVKFDLTVLDEQAGADLRTLLVSLDGDERVDETFWEEDMVLVSFQSNPRTQDSREPFDLSGAYAVLIEDDDGGDEDDLASFGSGYDPITEDTSW